MKNELIEKLSKYNVVYAEDERGIRENIGEFLSLLFNKVLIASNGEEAYTLYKNHHADLMITDIKMPKLSGIELVKKIREEDEDDEIHIIVVSAHTEVDYMLKAVELHLIRYIVKPLTESKLTEALERFLQTQEKQSLFSFNKDSYFNLDTNEVFIGNDVQLLTKKEADFLKLLMKTKKIVSYEEIENTLWLDDFMSLNALRLFIKNLRKKLPKDVIKNIQGIGYQIKLPHR